MDQMSDTTQSYEFVSIIKCLPDGGSEELYKQLALFEEGDFVQVVHDRVSRDQHSEAERFAGLALKKFGPRIKDLLPGVEWDGDTPRVGGT